MPVYDAVLRYNELTVSANGDWCKSDTSGFDPEVIWAVQISPTISLVKR